MKRGVILLAVVSLASISALTQQHARRGSVEQDREAWTASTKALTVSGKVSDDGKRFTTDIDSEWEINNPDTLKGHEGQVIAVKCYVDSERNKIQVLSVKRDVRYTAMYRDSAFRR